MTRKRLKALHFDHHMVEDVSELVNLHLRFHGYVEEPWTDSAVRRYVKDAGPLYERLNRLTRADTTTQNKRKAMVFAAAMDEMEQRVRDLKKKEDFDAIRPDLNGDEIMRLLGIEPGPMVGKAYRHMLEYRLDNGRSSMMWPWPSLSAGTRSRADRRNRLNKVVQKRCDSSRII